MVNGFKIRAYVIALLLAVHPVLQCQTTEKSGTLVDPMVGADTQELISVYGEPTIILTISNGRRIYTYDASSKTHFRKDGRRCNDAFVVDADGMVVDFYCR